MVANDSVLTGRIQSQSGNVNHHRTMLQCVRVGGWLCFISLIHRLTRFWRSLRLIHCQCRSTLNFSAAGWSVSFSPQPALPQSSSSYLAKNTPKLKVTPFLISKLLLIIFCSSTNQLFLIYNNLYNVKCRTETNQLHFWNPQKFFLRGPSC